MGVPVMLVVEDNIRYYSSFLPVIYTELISQARRLISEGLNVAHKLVRMRARPKILLASNYEDAAHWCCVPGKPAWRGGGRRVSRVHGKLMPEAGFELARMIRSIVPDVPIVLQSGRPEFMDESVRRGVFVPAKAFAHVAGRPARLADRPGWVWRFHLPPA